MRLLPLILLTSLLSACRNHVRDSVPAANATTQRSEAPAAILDATPGSVLVVDSAGKPVEGAEVHPVSLSIDGQRVLTNARGEASVPINVSLLQPTKWVDVSKPGFELQQVPIPETWPLKVVLHPMKRP